MKRKGKLNVVGIIFLLLIVISLYIFFYEKLNKHFYSLTFGKHDSKFTSNESINSSLRPLTSLTVTSLDISATNTTSLPMTSSIDICELWKKASKVEPLKSPPTISLDPNKFLYPGLIWGPNNQITGLYQSIYLAIRLNRTLVIPKYHAHFTSIGDETLGIGTRIDLDYLRSFISTITIDEFYGKCNGSFDVAFQARIAQNNMIESIERDTNMKILEGGKQNWRDAKGALRFANNKKSIRIPSYPIKGYLLTKQPWLSGNENELRRVYNSSLPCAAYIGPFRAIRLNTETGKAAPLSNKNDITKVNDKELYSAVVYAVKWPLSVVKAAESYISTAFHGVNYIAVHWRYDPYDWEKHCREGLRKKSTCDLVHITEPKNVLDAINNTLTVNHFNDNYYLYIATPSSINNYKNEIYSNLSNTNLMYSNLDLKTYLIKHYKICWDETWGNIDEIVSLVEMVIMEKSIVFFHSPISSWSWNILAKRKQISEDGIYHKKENFSILESVQKVMEKRMG